MTVQSVLDYVNSLAPVFMKYDWDNVGLLCGRKTQPVNRILVALDPFLSVCKEAAEIGADLIVTHHPLIFDPVKAVTDDNTIGESILFLAEHGIAAINAGGVTIHSFFQLPLHPYIPGVKVESKFAFSKEKRSIIRTIDVLIIDEISMVRSDLLDAVDSVLRRFRDRTKPFGGVQLLMIGDLQQLTPVVTDEEAQLLSSYYTTPYFFGSHALGKIEYVTIELKQVFRQQDERFISILNAIRSGRPSSQVMDALNARYMPSFSPEPEEGYIRLTTHNSTANSYNEQQLELLDEPVHRFDAAISGNFPEYSYPTEVSLELKKGAQVMFVKNDPSSEKRYYNGKIGHVSEIVDDVILVQCPGEEEPVAVEQLEWENSRYVINEQTQEMETEVQGIFR